MTYEARAAECPASTVDPTGNAGTNDYLEIGCIQFRFMLGERAGDRVRRCRLERRGNCEALGFG